MHIIQIKPSRDGWDVIEDGRNELPPCDHRCDAIREAALRSRRYEKGVIQILNDTGAVTNVMPFERFVHDEQPTSVTPANRAIVGEPAMTLFDHGSLPIYIGFDCPTFLYSG